MTDPTLLAAVRHNCWANGELLRFCAALPPDRLEWTAPGTYGTIQLTLQHIVRAEEGYLAALTGADPEGGLVTLDHAVPLEELVARERRIAERIERALGGTEDPQRRIKRPSGTVVTARVLVAQLIHHGTDHRTHVGTILGVRGVEGPDLDVWSYGRSIGEVSLPPA